MDIRKCEVFLCVVNTGNFTKAGEELGYTQSGISHMMKGFEAELGFPLLVRSRNRVYATEEGNKLLPIIRELLNWNEHFNQMVSAINGVYSGKLRIGTYVSISRYWLPRIIKRFQADYPGISLYLMEGDAVEIEEQLNNRLLDCAFISRQPSQTFDWIPLRREPLIAVLPKGHPLENLKAFPVTAFNNESFIQLAKGLDYDVNRALNENNTLPDVKFSITDDITAINMVENGLGISILSSLILKDHSDAVVCKELDPPQYRDLGIAMPSLNDLSPAAKKFITYAQRVWEEEL